MNLIFDTHAHYDDEAFDADREELLASMPENGVGLIVDPGCDLDTSRRSGSTTTGSKTRRGNSSRRFSATSSRWRRN